MGTEPVWNVVGTGQSLLETYYLYIWVALFAFVGLYAYWNHLNSSRPRRSSGKPVTPTDQLRAARERLQQQQLEALEEAKERRKEAEAKRQEEKKARSTTRQSKNK